MSRVIEDTGSVGVESSPGGHCGRVGGSVTVGGGQLLWCCPVLELRRQLTAQGLDAGADTIAWHLEHHHRITLSRATIYRLVRRANLVVAEPAKKPRSSYIRFEAQQPNETWQADFTHHRLADGGRTSRNGP